MTTSTPQEINSTTIPTSFSFLPLQYSFGHKLKSTSILPPFSKLFFTGNTKHMLSTHNNLTTHEEYSVIHDQELCMFYIKLDSKGTTGKKERKKKKDFIYII